MEITLINPLDMHLHLREGDMMKAVTPYTSQHFSGAVIMPNLIEPVDDMEKLTRYRDALQNVSAHHEFTPYMTLFYKNYTQKELIAARDHIIGIKLYPAGITTQSEKGVKNFSTMEETLHFMEELNIPLLIHGESDGFVMDREKEFLVVIEEIARRHPKLHIIMEHITTADAITFLDQFDNLSATVTLHHLLLTLDDVVGGLMQPDHFCKPIAKTPGDLEALRKAVFSGHPKIMFGSDSAPHPRNKKECIGCAAGIFSSPVALPLLVQIFEEEGCLDLLQSFISDNAVKRYSLSPKKKEVTLTKKSWKVPEIYGDVRPFYAGQTIRWAVTSVTWGR